MTLDKARELPKVQAGFGGFYNRNSAKPILAEVNREHGRGAVDQRIRERGLDRAFGFEPGARFEGGLAVNKNQYVNKHKRRKITFGESQCPPV